MKGKTMQTDDKRDEAIAWHIRLSEPTADGAEWAAFNDWLDADPAHADAYDMVALDDARLSDILNADDGAQNDNEPEIQPWYRRRGLLAVAASALIAVAMTPVFWKNTDFETIQTRPGETREIALADGSRIMLNGDTRIALDRDGDRFARLEAGEALFTIRHDAARPFIVETGDVTLKDIGTVFNVRQSGGALDVAVSEGAVAYNPKAEAITVAAGMQLQRSQSGAKPVLTNLARESVAGWRQGRLNYQNALLQEIAVDLSRATGDVVTVSPALATRRFTGTIRIEGDRKTLFHRLGALLGVRARRSKTGWELTS
jgi:transmembrane sensor